MRVFVNDMEITLAEGMTVRHAITALAGKSVDISSWVAHDRWGNAIGLDGSLRDGECIKAEMVRRGNK